MTRELVLRRNWASAAGGARVRSFTGSDYTEVGCGPAQLIDDDPATVWGTDAPDSPGLGGPKQLVVALPADVTVTGIAIDPSSGCGVSPQAELAGYRVKLARDDDGDLDQLETVASGTFAPGDVGAARELALSATKPGVRYVQLQALGNHGDPIGTTVAELQVFGHPTTAAELAATTPAAPPAPAQGAKGDPGVAGAPGPRGATGPRGASAPVARGAAVTCTVRGTRAISCAFAARVLRLAGARARLSRGGRTLASGIVRGRVLRMRARRAVRPGAHILTITRGRGRAATVRRMAVRL